jgi:hypothetical protein
VNGCRTVNYHPGASIDPGVYGPEFRNSGEKLKVSVSYPALPRILHDAQKTSN